MDMATEAAVAAKRAMLEKSAANTRALALELVEMIDRGDYAYVGVERNTPLRRSAVDTTLDAIASEARHRDCIIQHIATNTGRRFEK